MEDLRELASVDTTEIIEVPLLPIDDKEDAGPTSFPKNSGNTEYYNYNDNDNDNDDEDQNYEPRYIRRFQDRIKADNQKATSVATSKAAQNYSKASSESNLNFDFSRDIEDYNNSSQHVDLSASNSTFESNSSRNLKEPNDKGDQSVQRANYNADKNFADGFHHKFNSESGVLSVWSQYGGDAYPVAPKNYDDPGYDSAFYVSDYAASDDAIDTSKGDNCSGAITNPVDNASSVAGKVTERLEYLHQHDRVRDQLIRDLHQENVELHTQIRELRKAMVDVDNGSIEPRTSNDKVGARAAGKRRANSQDGDSQNRLFVYVLIDCEEHYIHEDLLLNGRRGGAEFAHRLELETRNHLQEYKAGHWDLVAGVYVDINSMLAKYSDANISLDKKGIMDFICSFNQAHPLFEMVDVGSDRAKTARKIASLLRLYLHNTQCMHVFIGPCYKDGYELALGPFVNNLETTSRITILKSSHVDDYYDALPFQTAHFTFVFRSQLFSETTKQGKMSMDFENGNQLRKGLAHNFDEPPIHVAPSQAKAEEDAVANWQSAANGLVGRHVAAQAMTPASSPTRRIRPQQSGRHLAWNQDGRVVLLNVNNERVDSKLEEVDYEVSEDMLDRMEVLRFCSYYHLLGSCFTHQKGRPCKYRHGPELSSQELVVLRKYVRRIPCDLGSSCRRIDCFYGHICQSQPGCTFERCAYRKFHGVDSTAVKVWRSS